MAVNLAAKHGGTLTVIHAIPPFLPSHGRPIPPPAIELAKEARELADVVAAAVKGRRLKSVRTRVMVGSPGRCILAASQRADAIVMGTLGRTGLPHLVLGSVAERVIRHAAVPVLTVPARRGRRRGFA